MILFTEVLGNKDQIQDVDHAIIIGVRGGFTEAAGNKDQIQDVGPPIAVDIGGVFALGVDFAVRVGELVGFCFNQMSTEL